VLQGMRQPIIGMMPVMACRRGMPAAPIGLRREKDVKRANGFVRGDDETAERGARGMIGGDGRRFVVGREVGKDGGSGQGPIRAALGASLG